jgi:hypothetical protein
MYAFLDKLIKLYKLSISTTALFNTDIEKNMDVVMSRIQAEMAASHAATTQSAELDKSAHEKKLIALKEQLSNKEVHLNLLRKKIIEYEEKETSLSAVNAESLTTSRSSSRKLEKLSEELARFKSENVTLKAKVFDMEKIIVK